MNSMTIGEAAQLSGLPAKTIRYYEEIGLLQPASRGDNNYRSYGGAEIGFLRFVSRARGLGFSLKDVHELVALYRDRNRSSRDVKDIAFRRIREIDKKVAELVTLRDAIQNLAEKCQGDHRPECPILEELAIEDRSNLAKA